MADAGWLATRAQRTSPRIVVVPASRCRAIFWPMLPFAPVMSMLRCSAIVGAVHRPWLLAAAAAHGRVCTRRAPIRAAAGG